MTTTPQSASASSGSAGRAASWTALAVAAHVALLSAAIETFRSGSAVRWWVGAVVLTYLAALAATWSMVPAVRKRLTPATLAGSGAGLLLALVATTTWLPGGMTVGMRLFGMPTSMLLSAWLLGAVSLATFALARMARVPRALRWTGLALGVYGVIAFALALLRGTSYVGLFHGEGLGGRLPIWMQGAFVGALVVVPLALIAEALTIASRLLSKTSAPWSLRQALALLLALTTALAGVTAPMPGRASPGASRFSAAQLQRPLLPASRVVDPLQQAQTELGLAVTAAPGPLQPNDVADRLEMTFDAMSRVEARIPRDSFDPDAIVASAGRDPAALLAWVRSETALVPYRGQLRGPIGVLLDRVGNSLDRSLLLFELLKRSGQDVRLARAALSSDQAAALLRTVNATSVAARARPADPTAATVDEFLTAFSKRFGGDPSALRARTTAIRDAAIAVGVEAARRAEVQSAALMPVIGGQLQKTLAPPEPGQLSSLADHWWVQQRQGERWTDLDPTGVAGAAGLSPSSTLQASEIGDDMKHTLRIHVAIECASASRLDERTIIDYSVRLSDVVGVPLNLRQFPLEAPADGTLADAGDSGAAMLRWLSDQQQWQAVLSLGSTSVGQSVFTIAGEVNPSSAAAPAAGAGGGLFGALDAGVTESAAPDGRLTAEFVDFELRVPGRPVKTERRYLFDWLGPRARLGHGMPPSGAAVPGRALDVAIQTEVLPLGAQPSSEFVAHLAASSMISGRAAVVAALRGAPWSAAAPANDAPEFPGELYALALARRDWSRYSSRVYLAEPNILCRHRKFAVDREGRLLPVTAFDIVANTVDVAGAARADLIAVRLNQGVLDTNAEALLANGDAPATNVAEASAAGGVPTRWIAVTASDHSGHLPELAAGRIVVVPIDKEGHPSTGLGWWRADPATGTVVGMTENGWGGTQGGLAEFARLNEQQIRTAAIIFRVMMMLHCQASWMRKELAAPYTRHKSALGAGASGLFRGALCTAGMYFGMRGIVVGGAYGNLLSRTGDIFSIAFSISSYF